MTKKEKAQVVTLNILRRVGFAILFLIASPLFILVGPVLAGLAITGVWDDPTDEDYIYDKTKEEFEVEGYEGGLQVEAGSEESKDQSDTI